MESHKHFMGYYDRPDAIQADEAWLAEWVVFGLGELEDYLRLAWEFECWLSAQSAPETPPESLEGRETA